VNTLHFHALAGVVAIAVAAGYVHTCAVLNDGTVCCWGDNTLGQVGISGHTTVLIPAYTRLPSGMNTLLTRIKQ
jgi:alpha-tubulin suppressor-like RCC1 family protein